ncbi:D,D-heptose 1,7-bisphosphate phosphatase [Candidatus Magnetobacterium bavaricum]|uniref:D,D-heptose 1,7-bisphosphate phosphatase n=1 Tax=Candidatus Magnetobacterium bavaricum TaxID=29290 RepID=A0A0F3GNQ4_9BACT|nr:D,D-heptose 1,7-bisphosphate phosphatase [Candidatus Magnetobacterium bavaricum]
MKLVILSGGKGTRLGLKDIPKSMVPIGEKPLLEHQINLAKQYGIKEVYLLSSYLSDIIIDYFGDGSRFGVNIFHILDTNPLGTSGAVKMLESKINERFMIFYGDIVLNIDIGNFIAYDASFTSIATLIVHPNAHPYDSDLVEINDNNTINRFHSKPHKDGVYYSNNVNAAVYILSPAIFKYIPYDRPSDFGKDIFPYLLKCGEIIKAYRSTEYIKDIGTNDRYNMVNMDFLDGKVHRLSRLNKRPAIFIDRDGTLIKHVDLLHRAEDLELYPYAAKSLSRINQSDYLCFLITNQSIIARNLCSLYEYQNISNKIEFMLGQEGAYFNDIYYCPHHPHKGYGEENPEFKIDCNCRKPKPGMVTRAVKDYNVDIDSSWLIGDTTTDIQTGINANMTTVLLRSGIGGKDNKFDCSADYVFENLQEAVDFILDKRHRYDNIIKEILHNVKDSSPRILSVSGLARSGKSTFTRLLNHSLQKKGYHVQVINLDNWLLGVNERSGTMTVRDRYKYKNIEADIMKLLRGDEVTINIYNPLSRQLIKKTRISLNNPSWLIIDGVPALDIKGIRDIADINIYIDIDENTREERFFSFYKWKGLTEEEIKKVYTDRLSDEIPYIKESKQYAHIIVTE